MRRTMLPAWLTVLVATSGVSAAEVSGRVVMPEVCAPAISPAVVILEPKDTKSAPSRGGPSHELALVDQRGLQFVPRVQAMSVGQTLRFTNEDSETHNVHGSSRRGNRLQPVDDARSTPRVRARSRPGRGHEADVRYPQPHAGLRRRERVALGAGLLAVGSVSWLDGVPEGRYTLTVWHEMGDRLERGSDGHRVGARRQDLGTLSRSRALRLCRESAVAAAPAGATAGPT